MTATTFTPTLSSTAPAAGTTRRQPKVLIFIVAYEAESTLRAVLDRIPAAVFADYDTEVLVIDDCSQDETFDVGVRTAAASPYRVTVLANSINQGYGGNQKLGYQYAIRHGFDFVILLHGDGQYAPECIPLLLQPLAEERADAVFGSRMLSRFGALKGGMPLYKFVGNKILTTVQNRLLKSTLSEFHSGFRAYRVAALARIPFQYNANVFHFDTEIVIQLMLAQCRVLEVPIPTYYGDEICRVDGMKYAKDVLGVTIASRLHGMNIFYDRKFDIAGAGNAHYAIKRGYVSSHTMAFDAVPSGSRVLDIGCGSGAFARLLAEKGCTVSGVDQYAAPTGNLFEEFAEWQEPAPLPLDASRYEYILLLDIIEHLTRPETFLDQLRSNAAGPARQPTVILTTGNVVFFVVRLQALLGQFNYGKRGILDLTHTRLYTFKTLRELFEQCGYQVEETRGIPAPYPEALGDNLISRALLRLNLWLIKVSKGLFSYQIYMRAKPRPTLDTLLNDSIDASRVRAESVRTA